MYFCGDLHYSDWVLLRYEQLVEGAYLSSANYEQNYSDLFIKIWT